MSTKSPLPRVYVVDDVPRCDASGSGLRELLALYEEELVLQGCPIRSYLGKPLDAAHVRRRMTDHQLSPTEEAVALFGWADGFSRPMPCLFLASLEDCLFGYRMRQEMLRHPEPGLEGMDWGAPEGWMPLENDNYGLAIECLPGTHVPEVRAMTPDFDEDAGLHRVRSLSTIIVWAIEGLRGGAYRWQPSRGVWQMEYHLVPEMQRMRELS